MSERERKTKNYKLFKNKIMKKQILSISSILLVTIAIVSSCQSPKTKVENAEIKVQEAKQDLVESKEDLYQTKLDTLNDYNEFKIEAERSILDQEKKIKELKSKMAKEKKELNVEYNNKLIELENSNNKLKRKLAEFKNDGEEKWISFKKEFNHDMKEFGKAFKALTVDNTK
jgi:hypothetical protein